MLLGLAARGPQRHEPSNLLIPSLALPAFLPLPNPRYTKHLREHGIRRVDTYTQDPHDRALGRRQICMQALHFHPKKSPLTRIPVLIRYCDDQFDSESSTATIGVDFKVRNYTLAPQQKVPSMYKLYRLITLREIAQAALRPRPDVPPQPPRHRRAGTLPHALQLVLPRRASGHTSL
jgi:hypothetical protein